MDDILNCKPELLDDYYGLLGCDELSSTEQIANEYRSMHWAVRTKKEPMLESSKATFPNSSQDRDCTDHEVPEMPSPDAVPSSSDYCHRHFRWASDSPSSLLRKFRNYEI
ncbi:unnamed protein product [Coregonus sp. 'balchen']|nr:unnamed protein product [Coregonus sp. 'balchen']